MIVFADLPKSIQNEIYIFASPWKKYKTDNVLDELKTIVIRLNIHLLTDYVISSVRRGLNHNIQNFLRDAQLSVYDSKLIIKVLKERKTSMTEMNY